MPKALQEGYAYPWQPTDPCPCGSRLPFQACCLKSGRALRVNVPSVAPPGPKTGHSKAGCYLSHTEDCSDSISGEHYISEAILREFGSKIEVTGLPWRRSDGTNLYSPSDLTANILCRRHNSSLGPLDDAALAAVQAIANALEHVTMHSTRRMPYYFIASGDALERWAVKTLIGLYNAKIARAHNAALRGTYSLDVNMTHAMIRGDPISPPLGLYIRKTPGPLLSEHLSIGPLLFDRVCGGIYIEWLGFKFLVIVDPTGFVPDFRSTYRPSMIDFVGPRRAARLFLTWPPGDPNFLIITVRPEPNTGSLNGRRRPWKK